MSDGWRQAVRHNSCGAHRSTGKTVNISYVRRAGLAVEDRLCPTAAIRHNAISDPNVRQLETVGDNQMSSDISYVWRFKAYVRRLWPSEVDSFTVVTLPINKMTKKLWDLFWVDHNILVVLSTKSCNVMIYIALCSISKICTISPWLSHLLAI
jgi:hypothetical protein